VLSRRRLPKEYGKWHVIYKRFSRWVKSGVIERLFHGLHAMYVGFIQLPFSNFGVDGLMANFI